MWVCMGVWVYVCVQLSNVCVCVGVCVQLQDKHCTDFAVEKLCVGGVCVCVRWCLFYSLFFSLFFFLLSFVC